MTRHVLTRGRTHRTASALAALLATLAVGSGEGLAQSFSVARAGASGFDPADVLVPGSPAAAVAVPCVALGFVGCGGADELDALTTGGEAFQPPPAALLFSVAPGSEGAAGTAVSSEAACAPAEPHADLFTADTFGAQTQFADGDGVACGSGPPAPALGLEETGSVSDNVDAFATLPPLPGLPVFVSLGAGSPTLGAVGAGPADILTLAGGLYVVWAPAAALGLTAGDELDGACLSAGAGPFVAGTDTVLFSLAAGSPTLAANGWSAADVLAATTGGAARAIPAADLGLAFGDDVDALGCNLPLLAALGKIPPGGGTGGHRGDPKDIAVSPSGVVFGDVFDGETAVATVTVTNTGSSEPLVLGPLGLPEPPFSVENDTCSATVLAPGLSCTFDAVFAPTAAGTFADDVAVMSDDPDEPAIVVALSGTGVAKVPDIAVDPASLDFGATRSGVPVQRALVIANLGAAPLVVTAIESSHASFAQPAPVALPLTLAPGESTLVLFEFDQDAGGLVEAVVRVRSDDPDEALLEVPVSAVAVAPPTPLAPKDGASAPRFPSFTFTADPAGLNEPLTYVVEIRRPDGTFVGSIDQAGRPDLGWSKPAFAPGETGMLEWPSPLERGPYDWRVAVRYANLLSDLSAPERFVVAVAPTIDLAPDELTNGAIRRVTVLGRDFDDVRTFLTRGGRAGFDPGDVNGKLVEQGPSHVVAEFDLISSDYVGEWDLVVENGDGLRATKTLFVNPAEVWAEIRGAGVLGFPVVPAGSERLNSLEISSLGDTDGFMLLELVPPGPPINLKVGSRTTPTWDSAKEENPELVQLLTRVPTDRVGWVWLYWGVPPEKVIFPQPAPTAMSLLLQAQQDPGDFVVFGENGQLSWSGVKGATKEQVKGIVKATLLATLCKGLGQNLTAAEFLDLAIEQALAALQSATSLPDIGAGIAQQIAALHPGVAGAALANDLLGCLKEFAEGFAMKLKAEAKAAADRLRALEGNDAKARARGFEECLRRAGHRAYGSQACFELNAALQKPVCNPPPVRTGSWTGPVRGPFDPNDKTFNGAYELGDMRLGGATREIAFVPEQQATEPIEYVVSFENLPAATDAAENVVVTDVLDADFDVSSFELLRSSHPEVLSVEIDGRSLSFRFSGVDLPPNRVAPEGEGFVQFSVRPKPGLPLGTQLRNQASIVFDFNPPIVTGETIHVIGLLLSVQIDIKPGSAENPINLGSRGVTPVALLATAEFDPLTADLATVLFEGAPVARSAREDVDGDGDVDTVLFFTTQAIRLTPVRTIAGLTGLTRDGRPFRGADVIRIVP